MSFILRSKGFIYDKCQEPDVIMQRFSFQYFYCFLEYLGPLTSTRDFSPIQVIKISQIQQLNNISSTVEKKYQ